MHHYSPISIITGHVRNVSNRPNFAAWWRSDIANANVLHRNQQGSITLGAIWGVMMTWHQIWLICQLVMSSNCTWHSWLKPLNKLSVELFLTESDTSPKQSIHDEDSILLLTVDQKGVKSGKLSHSDDAGYEIYHQSLCGIQLPGSDIKVEDHFNDSGECNRQNVCLVMKYIPLKQGSCILPPQELCSGWNFWRFASLFGSLLTKWTQQPLLRNCELTKTQTAHRKQWA